MSITAILLHWISASVMLWGYTQLDTLVSDAWIKEQTGGHWQYLTVLSLAAACITMLLGLTRDIFPSIKGLYMAQRMLLMISLPVAILVALIYWSLLSSFPALILLPMTELDLESSSPSVPPPLWRIPLRVDLALHAVPTLALVTEFIVFQTPYPSYDVTFIAPVLTGLTAVGYSSWSEYCGFHNGEFPYPFLTQSPFKIRMGIYAASTLLSLSLFRGLNRLHPHKRTVGLHQQATTPLSN